VYLPRVGRGATLVREEPGPDRAFKYLAKPFSGEALRAKLREVVDGEG
jgi:hypothetical protein